MYGTDSLFCPVDRSALVHDGGSDQVAGTLVAERYLLAELIGSGGMGEVYRAQDVRLQRPAAVKLLRASFAADLDALRRFRREGMNASRINNPHVVQVYDAGETEAGIPYLAMEFVPGRSLGRILAEEARLSPARAAALIGQIAAGLDAAHRLGIVHRDLKPDNILVTRDESGGEAAKVVDFGISRAIRDEAQQVTKTGFVAGTYEFMSPEQVVGGGLDQRSDVYALALIAFMMLTGRLPFPGQTAEHSMLMRLSEAPLTLQAASPTERWDERLQAVFDNALAREPALRPGTAGQFASDLREALALPGPVGIVEGRWRRKAPRAAAGALAVALVGIGLMVGVRGGRAPAVALGTGPDDSLETADLKPQPTRPETSRGSSPGLTDTASRPQSAAPDPRESTAPVLVLPYTQERPAQPAPERPPMESTVTAPSPPRHPQIQPRVPGRSPVDRHPLLAPFDSMLHVDLPVDSVQLVLAALDAVLPRLRTPRDTVDAGIYRAEAYALGGQDERACALLDDIWPRATRLQRLKIGLWVDRGLCPGSEWHQS
jgi:eukaryotic-like serine/threonine-protein kinase